MIGTRTRALLVAILTGVALPRVAFATEASVEEQLEQRNATYDATFNTEEVAARKELSRAADQRSAELLQRGVADRKVPEELEVEKRRGELRQRQIRVGAIGVGALGVTAIGGGLLLAGESARSSVVNGGLATSADISSAKSLAWVRV